MALTIDAENTSHKSSCLRFTAFTEKKLFCDVYVIGIRNVISRYDIMVISRSPGHMGVFVVLVLAPVPYVRHLQCKLLPFNLYICQYFVIINYPSSIFIRVLTSWQYLGEWLVAVSLCSRLTLCSLSWKHFGTLWASDSDSSVLVTSVTFSAAFLPPCFRPPHHVSLQK